MDNYAKNLKEQKRWRSLFSYLQYSTKENTPIDTINLYNELVADGTITHTLIEYYDNAVEDEVELWVLFYTAIAFEKMEE